MKKNIIKISLSFLLAAFMISCEEDTVTYEGSDFVTFNQVAETTLSINENDGSVNIPVNITTPQPNDVVVNFTFEALNGAVAGVDYTLGSPSVTIPAGETVGNIVIQPIDNDEFNQSLRFNLKLTSVSQPNIAVGIADVGSYSKSLLILNDDCPTQFSYWIGNLDVEDVGYGSTAGTGGATANGDCDILVVNNNLPGASAPVNTKFNIIFTPGNAEGSMGTVEVLPTFVRVQPSGGVNYDGKYEGTGTYDTETGEIVIDYIYGAYTGSTYVGSFWTGTTVITRQ